MYNLQIHKHDKIDYMWVLEDGQVNYGLWACISQSMSITWVR